MYRRSVRDVEVFLVHPGGPFFAKKDEGVWGVPKGLIDPGETPLETARREFEEETGQAVERCASQPEFFELGEVTQKGGKRVVAWAFEGDWPEGALFESNRFELEWPRGSGRLIEVPEVDRGEFFDPVTAVRKINPAQARFVERLLRALVHKAGA